MNEKKAVESNEKKENNVNPSNEKVKKNKKESAKGKVKTLSSFRYFILSFAIAIALFSVSAAFFIAGRMANSGTIDDLPIGDEISADNTIDDEQSDFLDNVTPTPIELDHIEKDRLNVLLTATDESAVRTDTVLILSADKISGQISMISIPRDTRVMIGNTLEKINAVPVYKNYQELVNMIEGMTGIEIDYYMLMTPKSVIKMVDALDGIDFEVPQNMKYTDRSQGLFINLQKGMQHLDGNKVHQMLRFRQYLEGDLPRTDLQRKFMEELLRQKLNASNLVNIPTVFDTISKYMYTNITLAEAVAYLDTLAKMVEGDIMNYQLPGYQGNKDGGSYFFYDTTKTFELFKEKFGGLGSAVSGTMEVKEEHNISNRSWVKISYD